MEMGQDFNSTNERHAAGALQGLSKMMSSRHSTRAFLNTPVPRNVLEEALAVAQHAPSNSNLQPWRVKVVTGDALQRLTSALVSTVTSGVAATTVPIPEPYRHYRSSLGHQIYGPEGYDIPRTDPEGKFNAELRNYVFFDAPCAMIICIDRSLAQVDVLSVGMYVQTLCLLLEEQGIATCVEASVAGYPQVIEQELGLGPDMLILAGMAVGFEDGNHKVNHVKAERDAYKSSVEFLDS